MGNLIMLSIIMFLLFSLTYYSYKRKRNSRIIYHKFDVSNTAIRFDHMSDRQLVEFAIGINKGYFRDIVKNEMKRRGIDVPKEIRRIYRRNRQIQDNLNIHQEEKED